MCVLVRIEYVKQEVNFWIDAISYKINPIFTLTESGIADIIKQTTDENHKSVIR